MSTLTEKRLNRSEVPTEMTWNLTDLFLNRTTWLQKLTEIETMLNEIESYKTNLCSNGTVLFECMLKLENMYTILTQLGTYSNLRQSEDGTDTSNQEDSMLFSSVSTMVQTKISFINSEITTLENDDYQSLFEFEPKLEIFKNYLDEIYDLKSHKLSPETELAIASLGEIINAPYRIYSISKAADMTFDNFNDAIGNSLPNSFALFESKYEFSADPIIRKNAYDSFTKTLTQYKNTYASVYAAEVKKQIAMRKLRNFESVTHMLLKPQKVSIEMYNNQIDIVFKHLAPHMQRFAKLKQKQMHLPIMCFHDLKAPLDVDFNPSATYSSIKETLIKALSALGDDYGAIIERAYDERWIDYSDNVGKSTGAFCASPYGVHSYILISYQDTMRSAFTLAHELGHAGHFTLANKEQRIFNTRPSTYFIEAPSTMNEILLSNFLTKQTKDPQMKRWVILQLMGTYYHNFVTHLLEAEFQRRVYNFAESGGSLSANALCGFKLSVLKEFWGDSVEIDDAAGMTWMRQPHYFMGLYPYTYSAGLTVSTAIAQQIMSEGQPAISRWLDVLKTGGLLSPQDLIKKAGLDMTTPEPIVNAVNYVGGLISELEVLFQ